MHISKMINPAHFEENIKPKITELMAMKQQLEDLDKKHLAASYKDNYQVMSEEDLILFLQTHIRCLNLWHDIMPRNQQ